jgi:hypothetical protein
VSRDPEAGCAWLGCLVLVSAGALVVLAFIDVRFVLLWIVGGGILAVVLDSLAGD